MGLGAPQPYTFVHTSLEHVPEPDWAGFVRRQHGWVEAGGRLILTSYPERGARDVDVAGVVSDAGLELGGVLRPADHTVVWIPA